MHWKLQLLLLFPGGCWNVCPIINLLGVSTRITINTSLNRCLYNPSEIYIYVSCKIFHTSSFSVLTQEVGITPDAKEKINYVGFVSLGFGPWRYTADVLASQVK